MSSATSNNAAALLVGAALVGFDAGSIGFVLPAMRAATGADAREASWLVSLFVIGQLVALPLAGAAVRRFGAVVVFRSCVALAAAGAALAAFAAGTPALLAARLLQGLGQGPILPIAATLIALQWPLSRQGRYIGLISAAYGAAFLVAMVGTPALLIAGWRAAFVVSLVMALAALATRHAEASRELATAHASVPHRAWLQREALAIAALSFGTGVGQAALVYFPTLAMLRLHVTGPSTAILMSPLVVGGMAATFGITAAMDRVGARTLLAAGAAATLAGVLLAAAAPPSHGTFMAGAGLLGLGITGLCGGPLRYAAARAMPAGAQGLAQSAVALATNVGLLGGSIVIGSLAAIGGDERAALQMALLATCPVMAATFLSLLVLRGREAAATHAAAITNRR